ncbi:MAG: hypothetical protein R3253_06725 [Longimicrobiales bacterium]|nr:hypothetical protein [Longimicrobiales bacterium]
MDRPPLWTRLKEAKAVQVALVYLGVCWFVVQLVSSLQEMLELPAWLGPVTLVLLGIGLIVIVATALVQSLPGTTAAEEAGEIPTDWEIAPGDALESLKRGRLPHLTWGRAILGGVVAISLAIGAAGGYVLVRSENGLGPTPVEASGPAAGVAVLPFQVSGPGLDEFDEGMVSLVSLNLDGIDGIRSLNARTIMSEWTAAIGADGQASLDEALRVADATGARYAVVGDAVSTGSSVRFSAELYDVADGSVIGRSSVDGPLDEVLALIDRMSVDLAPSLVARVGTQSATGIQRLEGLVTSSLSALNDYFEGESHFREGRYRQALDAYQRAVSTDSAFALAWSRIASVHGWIDPGSPELFEARGKALEHIDRLPPGEAALIRGFADASSGVPTPGVLRGLRDYVRRHPEDPEGWAVLAENFLHVQGIVYTEEELDEAVLRPIDLDPDYAPHFVHGLRYLVGKGDWRFYEYMELYRGLVGEDRVQAYQRAWDFFYGDEAARAAADSAYSERRISALNASAEISMRNDSIGPRSLELISYAGRHPLRPVFEATALVGLGRFDEVPGDDPDRGLFHRTMGIGVSAVIVDASVAGWSPRDASNRFQELVEEAREADELWAGVDRDSLVGELQAMSEVALLLASGQAAGALDRLGEVSSRGGSAGGNWWLALQAEARSRTGDLSGAALAYQVYLPYSRGIAHLRLGEIHEAMGEEDEARRHYAAFLGLFADADESVSHLVERGQEGLQRVGG